ncbi:MAG: hypothetical protein EB053_03095 [Chlamydiae bacterium]|nr:hypothetical protein [Chlamydiota bacterium]
MKLQLTAFLPLFLVFSRDLLSSCKEEIRLLELGANYVEFQTQSPSVNNYFLDTDYNKENPPTYKRELNPTDRNFMALKAYSLVTTPFPDVYLKNTLFLSNRRLYYTDKESVPGIHSIAYIYDLHQKHPINEAVLTKVINQFLFQTTVWDTTLQTFFQVYSSGFSLKPELGLRYGKIFQSCLNKLHFFYLDSAPIEELRNFNSFLNFKGFGPILGMTMDYRPFQNTFILCGIKLSSFFYLSNLLAKINVDNDFVIEDGKDLHHLVMNRSSQRIIIPNIDLGITLSYDRQLQLFSYRLLTLKFEGGVFLKSWLGADKLFQGTSYSRGLESISLKGWLVGTSIDF